MPVSSEEGKGRNRRIFPWVVWTYPDGTLWSCGGCVLGNVPSSVHNLDHGLDEDLIFGARRDRISLALSTFPVVKACSLSIVL